MIFFNSFEDREGRGGSAAKTPAALWRWHEWQALPPDVLYGFLKLRSDIFVVEQNCVFSDMDGIDRDCAHLCGAAASGELLAYLRLVPPGVKYPEPSIGRLVTSAAARRGGLARAAMQRGIQEAARRYPGQPLRIGAQHYVEAFYASLGFVADGEPYLEDGIPHTEMLLRR